MSTIKKIIVCTGVLFFFCNCASEFGKKINGNGTIITELRTTKNYDEIRLSGWMDFELITGNEGEIEIIGESNLIEFITTESDGNTLYIGTKNNTNINTNKPLIIKIPFKDISKVVLTGSGDVTSKIPINATSFTTSISGSGDISLTVNAQNIYASISGSGDIQLKGSSQYLEASVTGSGDFNSSYLNTLNAEAQVTGSGDIDVFAKNTLKARVIGSGDITYSGNPKTVDKKVTGSGDIVSKR